MQVNIESCKLKFHFSTIAIELSNYKPGINLLYNQVQLLISQNQFDFLEVTEENITNLSEHEQFDLICFIYYSCKEFDSQYAELKEKF